MLNIMNRNRYRFSLSLCLALLAGVIFLLWNQTKVEWSVEGVSEVKELRVEVAESDQERLGDGQRAAIGEVVDFEEEMEALVEAVERGSALEVVMGGETYEVLLRPRKIFAEGFQTTLGADFEGEKVEQVARVFGGRAILDGGSEQAFLAVNGRSFHLLLGRGGEFLEVRNEPNGEGFEGRVAEMPDGPVGCDCEKGSDLKVVEISEREKMADWEALDNFEIAAFDGQRNFPGTTDEGSAMFGEFYAQGGSEYERTLSHANILLAVAKDATDVDDPNTPEGAAELEAKAAEMFSWFGLISAVYEDQLGVRLHLSELILFPRTADFWPGGDGSGGPIASRTAPLGPFRSWLGAHRPRGIYQWDCAYRIGDQGMWYDAGGSIAGVAFVGTYGGSSGVGVGVYRQANGFRVMMHEVGHIWGMGHSSKGIMGGGGSGPGRWTFWGSLSGTTNPQQAYDRVRSRVVGTYPMRNPRESVYARDDVAATEMNTPVLIRPLENDLDETPFIGIKNSHLKISELGMIVPRGAGAARVSRDGQRVEFTPADGFEGQALFSYTVQGNVGNSGKGWLHKGDIGVVVGELNPSSVSAEVSPGDVVTVFLESNERSSWEIVSQPVHAQVQIMNAGESTMAIHALSTAVPGTSETFLYETSQLGQVTFTINYVAAPIVSDEVIRVGVESGVTGISLLQGVRAAGRHGTVIGGISTRVVGGFLQYEELPLDGVRLISATLLDPADGTLEMETVEVIRNGSQIDVTNGMVEFTPASGRSGLAGFEYVVEDNAGTQETFTGYFVFPLAEISSPSVRELDLVEGNGLKLISMISGAVEDGLSGSPALRWSMLNGPAGGVVLFEDGSAAETSAKFTLPGEYLIQLFAEDGEFSSSEELRVRVLPSDPGSVEHLAAWWKFDELAGVTTASDASGNGLVGTSVGSPGRVSGVSGSGYEFDGSSDYVRVDDAATALGDLGNGAISFWLRTNTSSDRTIWSAAADRSGSRYAQIHMDDGLVKFRVRDAFGGSTSSVNSQSTVNDNEWHHVVVSFEEERVAMFVDGEGRGSGTRSFLNRIPGLNRMNIGRLQTSGGTVNRFRGGLDDFRVYRRPLTEVEVREIFAEAESGLLGVAGKVKKIVSTDSGIDLSLAELEVKGATRVSWESLDGSVTFSNEGELGTEAIVSGTGAKTIRLCASSSEATIFRELIVERARGMAGAPVAVERELIQVAVNAPDEVIDLGNYFEDVVTPDGGLVYEVVEVSNEDLFTSTVVNAGNLTLDFSPTEAGVSMVTVRARDGDSVTMETQIEVEVAAAPKVSNGVFFVGENTGNGAVVGSLPVVLPEGGGATYEISAGNEFGTFEMDGATGVVRVANSSLLDLSFRAAFYLEILVDVNGASSGATMTVQVVDVDEAPYVRAVSLKVPRAAAAGTEVGTVEGRDEEEDQFQFSIVSGNEAGAFSIFADGRIAVANEAALLGLPSVVTLEIRASQVAAVLQGTGFVTIQVTDFLVDESSGSRFMVPIDSSLEGAWIENVFDDSSWTVGTGAFGYDTGSDFEPFFTTDLEGAMYDSNASVYVRYEFEVVNPAVIEQLFLRIRYEDGFVAYLNGNLIADGSEPNPLGWNSSATATRDEGDAVEFRDYDLTGDLGLLVAGTNVLAVQGLNADAASSDFLLSPRLEAIVGTRAPEVDDHSATAITATGATLRGDIDDAGGENPTVTMHWGLIDGGTDPGGWQVSRDLGIQGEGVVSEVVTGMLPGVTYFVRMRASNSGGIAWTGERSFKTLSVDPTVVQLIPEGAGVRAFVPLNGNLDGAWQGEGFDDSGWMGGTTGVGYERSSGYQTLIDLDLEDEMFDKASGVYLRIAFEVVSPSRISALTLRMKYDDGFVAYLNGVEVNRSGFGEGIPVWDSTASGSREEDTTFSVRDLNSNRSLLHSGRNVLAIHGLNSGAGSSDFLILPVLEATYQGEPRSLSFSGWMSGFPGVLEAGRSPFVDSDGDGANQLAEYAFGGNPRVADASMSGLKEVRVTGGGENGESVEFGYQRRIDYEERGISFRLERSPDMDPFEGWETVVPLESRPPEAAGDGLVEKVFLRIPIGSTEENPRLFFRLVVELTE